MGVAFRDPYEVLGVARSATQEEIRQAYRRLARQYHPDISKDPDAEQRFKEVSEAYDILRDPEKRERYDRLGPNWQAGAAPGQGEGFEDVTMDFGEADFRDLSDLFEGLFGGGGRRGRRARPSGFEGFSARGADQEALLELSLEEAARGGRRSISVGGRDFDVEIPPGVRDGQRIRLAGAGEAGLGGGPSGDLFLRVRLRPHPRFRVEGRDLHTELRVAPWEAALGASVEVHTLQGRAHVRVPAGSSCGRRLRLRGQGMPDPGGTPGDLFAEVKIVVPNRLTQEERELFERLRDTSGFDPPARTLMAFAIERHSAQPVAIRVLAREAGVHPDLAARFVAAGLLAPMPPRDAATRLARAARLRRDLGLNYAGAVLACELLARIEELERRLSRYESR